MQNTVDSLCIADFDYLLPDNRIAFHPLPNRDASKLLIIKDGSFESTVFRTLPGLLIPGSLLVFNDTRVVEARLIFYKPTGSRVEIFCLEPLKAPGGVTVAMGQTGQATWKCLIGNAAAWTEGLILERTVSSGGSGHTLRAALSEKKDDQFVVEFSWDPASLTFGEILHEHGQIPLPPYIKRNPEKEDSAQYQTVYAEQPGSVAAPTAGLHFTEAVLNDLDKHRIGKDFVTLHVGAGTFKPVKAKLIRDHVMHSEYIEIRLALVKHLLKYASGNIAAVGTTSLRTIESIYWIGHRLLEDPTLSGEELEPGQWYPYQITREHPVDDCLKAVISRMESTGTDLLITKTSLMIAPGYRFRLVNQLITNFHQPKSTLLLLVAAFAGGIWKSAYAYALKNDFRFLSYGDACLFFRQ
jgi:S-adenosylmethionine:tRNA ribosyltransferase-isomerase